MTTMQSAGRATPTVPPEPGAPHGRGSPPRCRPCRWPPDLLERAHELRLGAGRSIAAIAYEVNEELRTRGEDGLTASSSALSRHLRHHLPDADRATHGLVGLAQGARHVALGRTLDQALVVLRDRRFAHLYEGLAGVLDGLCDLHDQLLGELARQAADEGIGGVDGRLFVKIDRSAERIRAVTSSLDRMANPRAALGLLCDAGLGLVASSVVAAANDAFRAAETRIASAGLLAPLEEDLRGAIWEDAKTARNRVKCEVEDIRTRIRALLAEA